MLTAGLLLRRNVFVRFGRGYLQYFKTVQQHSRFRVKYFGETLLRPRRVVVSSFSRGSVCPSEFKYHQLWTKGVSEIFKNVNCNTLQRQKEVLDTFYKMHFIL